MTTDIKKTTVEKNQDKPKTEIKLKHLTIKIPEDIHRKLKAKVALEGENVKSTMKKLVLEYVK